MKKINFHETSITATKSIIKSNRDEKFEHGALQIFSTDRSIFAKLFTFSNDEKLLQFIYLFGSDKPAFDYESNYEQWTFD